MTELSSKYFTSKHITVFCMLLLAVCFGLGLRAISSQSHTQKLEQEARIQGQCQTLQQARADTSEILYQILAQFPDSPDVASIRQLVQSREPIKC